MIRGMHRLIEPIAFATSETTRIYIGFDKSSNATSSTSIPHARFFSNGAPRSVRRDLNRIERMGSELVLTPPLLPLS